jgi:hypothetical protein
MLRWLPQQATRWTVRRRLFPSLVFILMAAIAHAFDPVDDLLSMTATAVASSCPGADDLDDDDAGLASASAAEKRLTAAHRHQEGPEGVTVRPPEWLVTAHSQTGHGSPLTEVLSSSPHQFVPLRL